MRQDWKRGRESRHLALWTLWVLFFLHQEELFGDKVSRESRDEESGRAEYDVV